jgi:ABC-type dipeptide/oligopeptide/nickel transport system permease component
MGTYIIRRIGLVCVVLFGVLTIVFFLQRLSGDPTDLLLPVDASEEIRREMRHGLGLDEPLPFQYLRFIGNALRGNLGESYKFKQPALSLVVERLPSTVLLATSALVLSILLAIPLGIIAAVYRNSWVDTVATGVSLIGQAIPVYWLGLLLILLFSVGLRWFPSMGGGSWKALVLPAVTLAVYSMARIARLTRSAVLDVLNQEYVMVARSKGLAERVVLFKHVLRNAAIPIATMVGLQFGGLLGGAVLTEMVFSWPGIGRLAVQAVYGRDFPVVQAVTLVVAALFSGINLLVDILYAVLNPQIRLE